MLPAFTAAAALYRPAGHYVAMAAAPRRAAQEIAPAAADWLCGITCAACLAVQTIDQPDLPLPDFCSMCASCASGRPILS